MSFTGDYYQDREALKNIINADEYLSIISRAQNSIRTRIKHCDITSQEEDYLSVLQDILWIEE